MITNLNIDAISDASIPDSKLQERYVVSTTPPNDEIWYTTTDGNVVSFNSTSCGANVVSNTYVNGKGVIKFDGEINAIGERAFYNCDSLTSVTIPDSVTTIGGNAFYNCTSLTSVTIGNGVTSIGGSAFYQCSSLTSITIGNSVTSIGKFAFGWCTNLTSVTIGDSVTTIGELAFHGCHSLTSITIPDSVTSIGDGAFNYCISLTSVTIGNGVTSIGEEAFFQCDHLTSVTIGDSVTTIGNSAFGYCKGELIINSKTLVENNYTDTNYPMNSSNGWLHGSEFTKLTIGDSVTKIGNHVFDSCTTLKSVTIGDSVTTIGYMAFSDCESLTSVTIPDSVTTIGHYAFYNCNGLTSVTIKDGVPEIGMGIFHGCTSLKRITIPNSLTTIGKMVFDGCTSLKSITIPNGVTSIETGIFRGCYSLTSITIPDSVTSIGSDAFEDCRGLTSIVIPDSVTSIGDEAFYYCRSLTSVTIGDSITTIGENVFKDCNSLTTVYCKPTTPPSLSDSSLLELGIMIYVPMESVDAYKSAEIWCDYVEMIIGCVFEDETLVSGENIKTINGESILGEGNIELGLGSRNFPSDDELWYISSAKSIQYAYEGAFGDSQVVSHTYENGKGVIKFDKALTEITMSVFGENERITSLYIPEKVNSIGQNAFGDLILTDVFMGPETAPELYDANVFGPWDTSTNLKIWIPGANSYLDGNETWIYYGASFKIYIKGGYNLIPGENISTINGRSIIGSDDFKLVTKDNNGYVDENLIPSSYLSLGSGLNPWNTVYATSVYGYGEFLINTNTYDWSLGTPAEGNDLCNISGGGGDMSLNSKDITIDGKNAVNIVVGDEDISQGIINVTPGAVSVGGYFYCSDNFEVNTNSECYATAFYETSDENLKDFTDDITVDFNKLKEIRKSYFTWKDGDQNLHIGTSAQDVQKVYPELVSEDNKGNLTVDYAKLSIIALSAIDKLDERLSRIENILNKEE